MLFKRKAILIIHGFAGGTYDNEKLANYLEFNKRYDVFQFTLPGHEVRFGKVKYQEWIDASEDMLKEIIDHGYKKIYLIGHSMGGVIATYLATKYKKVKKLVLGAPAFQYLRVEDDKLNVRASLKAIPGSLKGKTKSEMINRAFKTGTKGTKEFMSLVKKYYKVPKQLECPVLIIQGTSDGLVPLTSSRYVYDNVKSKFKKLVYIDKVDHEVFKKSRQEEIFKIVESFLRYANNGGIYKEGKKVEE